MSTLQADIVTPDGKVYDGEVNGVNARTIDGEIGVLPKHMPLVSPLTIGVVRLKHDETTEYVAVAGGFIEVTPDHVTILAEAAERKDHIDYERATHAKERAEQKLEDMDESHELYHHTQSELARAQNRIHVSKFEK